MTEEEARKAEAQNREFPETIEILGKLRDKLAERLFQTNIADKDLREDIYTRVQALDALRNEMAAILTANGSEKEMRAYIESLATTGK